MPINFMPINIFGKKNIKSINVLSKVLYIFSAAAIM